MPRVEGLGVELLPCTPSDRVLTLSLKALYRNLPVQHIRATTRAAQFVRFAGVILQLVKDFIAMGQRRVVQRLGSDGIVRAEDLSGSELRELYGGRDYMASPLHLRKRMKAEVQEDDEDEDW